MLNLSKHFHNKFNELWFDYLINIYMNNEEFSVSLQKTTEEDIDLYLKDFANNCSRCCTVSQVQSSSGKRKAGRKGKKGAGEVEEEVKYDGHYIINLPQVAINMIKKIKANWPWDNMKDFSNQFIEHCQSKLLENNIQKLEYNNNGCILITFDMKFVMEQMFNLADKSYGLETTNPEKIVVDFSSPNMAKKMHLGHLRSTIIGDVICRFFEFLGHDVHRINHIGDWGRPFAIVIAYFMHNKISWDDFISAEDLQDYYTEGSICFKENKDGVFEPLVYDIVKRLQDKDPEIYDYWEKICKVSRDAYQKIYDELDIRITDVGESTYQNDMGKMIDELEEGKHLKDAMGMKIVQIDGISNPFILQKSTGNGGNYTYDTSDLAALKHRTQVMKADRIYYVVDNGQSNHFELLFNVGQKVGYYHPDKTTVEHIKFGLVQSPSGQKVSSRKKDGDVYGLQDIIDQGKEYAKTETIKNNETREERGILKLDEDKIEEVSNKLNINSVKYFELTHKRTSNYKIDFDKIFNNHGNTANYINYAYARMYQIWDKFQKIYKMELFEIIEHSKTEMEFYVPEEIEMKLIIHLLKFPEAIRQMEDGSGRGTHLMPHNLTDYLYDLAQIISKFYCNPDCYCLNSSDPKNVVVVYHSRIVVVAMTLKVMNTLFDIIGIEKLDKI